MKEKDFSDLKDEVKRLKKKIKDIQQAQSTGIPQSIPRPVFSAAASQLFPPSSLPLPTQSSLFSSTQSSISSPSHSSISSPTHSISSPSHQNNSLFPNSGPLGAEEEGLYNGNTYASLEDIIGHTDRLYEAVKILMTKLFPDEYIATHSVSGKASNTTTTAKPCFDLRLYGAMLKVLKGKFSVDAKAVTEKVHSVQKSIQAKLAKKQ